MIKNPGRVVYMLRLQGKVLEVFSLQFVVMSWFGWVSQLAIAGWERGAEVFPDTVQCDTYLPRRQEIVYAL
jgi:hypothetical protein